MDPLGQSRNSLGDEMYKWCAASSVTSFAAMLEETYSSPPGWGAQGWRAALWAARLRVGEASWLPTFESRAR